ncbi:sirohydrochlorin chelatase [Halobacillus salinus]|uniref:sirohydrochlorin chelatase n=1 Tax=Halobacillus salinus TaxID=192814 RepID=UPI0009A71A6D|nr:sirohydrochlorin chelatase [Halobacillus salinus]
MEAVLYVSHGSRVKEARDQAEHFLHQVHDKVDVPLWKICFLELASPTIGEGIESLVEAGATKVVIIPVLLLKAGHYYKDVPDELEKAMRRFPDVAFQYGEPLGVQERIIDVLVERIESASTHTGQEKSVLLVGRGSRNPETKEAIESMARRIEQKIAGVVTDVCYLAACEPSFEEGLETALAREKSETIVVPYLWFTGILLQSMQKKVTELQEDHPTLTLASHLYDHPTMVQALADRVEEALETAGELKV